MEQVKASMHNKTRFIPTLQLQRPAPTAVGALKTPLEYSNLRELDKLLLPNITIVRTSTHKLRVRFDFYMLYKVQLR